MAYSYPSADEIMTEANKIPGKAVEKLREEWESYSEAYEEKYGHTPTPNRAGYIPDTSSYLAAYDWIPGAFETFTKPDIDALHTLTESMRTAQKSFDAGTLGWIDTAKQYMGDGGWDGAMSTNFINNFLTPMDPSGIPANHETVAKSLVAAMDSNEAVLATARHDALQLAKETLSALDKVTDSKGSDVSLGLAITTGLITIAGVALAPVTAGMSAGAALAINISMATVTSGIGVGDKFVPKDEPVPLGADTVNGVIKNMSDALLKKWDWVSAQEDDIIKALNDNYDDLTKARSTANSSKSSNQLVPLRPNLANKMNDGNALTHGLD